MKKQIIVLLTLFYTLNILAWDLTAPSDVYVNPSCSSWLYEECSVEVSGQMFYQFAIVSAGSYLVSGGTGYSISPSGCSNWTSHTSWFGETWWTYSSSETSAFAELGLALLDTEGQVPGGYLKCKITVTAANTLNFPSSVTSKVKYVKMHINQPTITPSAYGPLCYSNTRTFTVTNTPSSDVSSIDWDISSNLYEVSSTSNSITVRPYSSSSTGTGWVRPEYNMTCGDVVECQKEQFVVGKFEGIVVTGTAGVCPNSLYTYTAQIPLGHRSTYSYSWTYPSNWSKYSQYTNNLRLYTPSSPNYGTVRVSVSNGCGSSNYSGITVYPGYNCGGYYMASPNPAGEYTEIDIASEDAKTLEASYDSEITITVVDKMGALMMKEVVYNLPYQLNTSKFPKSEYVIQIISQAKNRETRVDALKIIVNH